MCFFTLAALAKKCLSLIKNCIPLINSQESVKPKYFLFSDEDIQHYTQLEATKKLDDTFSLVLDFFYLTRKIKMHCPYLELKDPKDNSRLGIELRQGIKTALPLEIDSVSEVHISFKYPRRISIGDVRRLLLWVPNIKNMPEILAVCRYCESLSEDSYQCDFLFFAVEDKQLKHIRQWIKQNYVLEKSKE